MNSTAFNTAKRHDVDAISLYRNNPAVVRDFVRGAEARMLSCRGGLVHYKHTSFHRADLYADLASACALEAGEWEAAADSDDPELIPADRADFRRNAAALAKLVDGFTAAAREERHYWDTHEGAEVERHGY